MRDGGNNAAARLHANATTRNKSSKNEEERMSDSGESTMFAAASGSSAYPTSDKVRAYCMSSRPLSRNTVDRSHEPSNHTVNGHETVYGGNKK